MSEYHIPVLLKECIEGLNIKPDGIYVDVTFGGGGHSREILDHLNAKGRLIAFDQDENAGLNAIEDKRFLLIRGNFRFIDNYLRYIKVSKIDGLLADLGVSSHHFDEADRGFAFRLGGDLDMRMNQDAKIKASDLVNTLNKNELKTIFAEYGEVENAYKLAHLLVIKRAEKPVLTVNDLKTAIAPCIPKGKENKYLAKVFQALRIAVNFEIEALEELLLQTSKYIKPGGRLVVITYHSLEDRLVKNYIRNGNFEGKSESDLFGNRETPFKAVNRNIMLPSEEELEKNPRARSAKLRIACKS